MKLDSAGNITTDLIHAVMSSERTIQLEQKSPAGTATEEPPHRPTSSLSDAEELSRPASPRITRERDPSLNELSKYVLDEDDEGSAEYGAQNLRYQMPLLRGHLHGWSVIVSWILSGSCLRRLLRKASGTSAWHS